LRPEVRISSLMEYGEDDNVLSVEEIEDALRESP